MPTTDLRPECTSALVMADGTHLPCGYRQGHVSGHAFQGNGYDERWTNDRSGAYDRDDTGYAPRCTAIYPGNTTGERCIRSQPDHDGQHRTASGTTWITYETTLKHCPARNALDGEPSNFASCVRSVDHDGAHRGTSGRTWFDPGAEPSETPPTIELKPTAMPIRLFAEVSELRTMGPTRIQHLLSADPDYYPVIPRPQRDQLIATLNYAIGRLEAQTIAELTR